MFYGDCRDDEAAKRARNPARCITENKEISEKDHAEALIFLIANIVRFSYLFLSESK